MRSALSLLLVVVCLVLASCQPINLQVVGSGTPSQAPSSPPNNPVGDPEPFPGCEVDANCSEFAEWTTESRSVVDARASDNPEAHGCTGVLLNSASGSDSFVMIPRHCRSGRVANVGENLSWWKFYFGRRSPRCGADVEKRVPPCTIGNRCITGGTVVASGTVTDGAYPGNHDFMLIRLSRPVPSSFGAYHAGWAIDGAASQTMTTMGYPAGFPLAITQGTYPANTSQRCGADNSMIRVPVDRGQLITGQSGSPVFDDRHLVRGFIRVGAGCNHPTSSCAVSLDNIWTVGNRGSRIVDYLAGGDTSVRRLQGSN